MPHTDGWQLWIGAEGETDLILEGFRKVLQNHMSSITHQLCAASLHGLIVSLFCLASFSNPASYSGSSVNYSALQEGRGTWWGVGSRIPDHKTWQPPSCIVHRHRSSPVLTVFSLWSVHPVPARGQWMLLTNMNPDQALYPPLFLPWRILKRMKMEHIN